MPDPSRQQFLAHVLERVRRQFPLAEVEIDPDGFNLRINKNFASLENLYRVSLQMPDEADHQLDRWVVEMLRAGEGHPDHREKYEVLRERIMPVLITGPSQMPAMVSQTLVAGLEVAYAIDGDRTIRYIPRDMVEKWKVTLDDLHETAIENLIRRSEQMPANAAQDDSGRVSLVLIQTMDGYDAARILLPTLNSRLREYLGSPFYVGIPNRDILICFRTDAELTERMKVQIASDFKTMPHQLTDKIFMSTPDGIAPAEV